MDCTVQWFQNKKVKGIYGILKYYMVQVTFICCKKQLPNMPVREPMLELPDLGSSISYLPYFQTKVLLNLEFQFYPFEIYIVKHTI